METVAMSFRGIVRFIREADIVLFILSLVSSIFGVVLIASAVAVSRGDANQDEIQIISLVIGVILFVLFTYIDIDLIADKSLFLVILSLLLLSTLLIWGRQVAGQYAWLRFGAIGIQPAELIKVPFIIVIAKMITTFKGRKNLNSIFSLMQVAAVFAIFAGAIMGITEDLGTVLVYVGVFVVMMFAGGVKLRWFAIAAVVLTLAAPLLWEYALSDRHREGIMAPFFPEEIDPNRSGILWQATMSIEAIATGGILGYGLGQGPLTQSTIMPAHHTDFIFSVAGEELGFVGCMALIILLVCMIIRCFYVGVKSNNSLGMLVCVGVGAMLIVQTIMNIGMALGYLPVIGITLPFFSAGGSSMVTCFVAMGIVSGIKMRPKPVRFRNL